MVITRGTEDSCVDCPNPATGSKSTRRDVRITDTCRIRAPSGTYEGTQAEALPTTGSSNQFVDQVFELGHAFFQRVVLRPPRIVLNFELFHRLDGEERELAVVDRFVPIAV